MYYSRLLFYSFLSNDKLKSLDDILDSFENENNKRVAKNLNLEKDVLVLIRNNINLFILNKLDYKIQNISALAQDETVAPEERAIRAINKFGKLSESEVPTPLNIATDMIGLLSEDCFENLLNDKTIMLDIASKIGEFTISIVKKIILLGIDIESIKSSILAIPTSTVAYEFTRKIYSVLGLDIDCIATHFTSYDLLNVKKLDDDGNTADEIDYEKIAKILKQDKKLSEITLNGEVKEGEEVKIEAVVGNPPYQKGDGGSQASARPIYHNFVEATKILKPRKFSMIMPSRWYAGGKGLNEFRNNMLNDICIEQLDDFLHPEEIFPDTNNRGGICYFLWNSEFDNITYNVKVNSHNGNGEINSVLRSMKTRDLDIFIRDSIGVGILNKVIPNDDVDVISDFVSPRKPFGIESNIIKTKRWTRNEYLFNNAIKCFGKGKQVGFVSDSERILHEEWINVWKLYTPRANNIGTELNDDNLNTFIGEPYSICTEAYIVIGAEMNLNYESALNLSTYFKTKFVRFLHSVAKASQDASRKTYKFIPLQDFTGISDIDWNKSIGEIDKQLYTKYNLTLQETEHIENKIKPME